MLARLSSFVSEPASPRPLAALRIGLAAVLLVQGLALMADLDELFGANALAPLPPHAAPDGVPQVVWLDHALGITNGASVRIVFAAYVVSLVGLLVGWRTRAAAVVALVTHSALCTSGRSSSYGVDLYAQSMLFYCVWMPVGHDLSLDVRAGRVDAGPTRSARLSLRVVQIHLCIGYLAAGLRKAAGPTWWSGEAIWRAVLRPGTPFDWTWLAWVPSLALLGGIATLLLEIGYPVFVWPKRTRRPWVIATIGMHTTIAIGMGLWSFSALLIVLTASVFLLSAEPRSSGAERAT